MPPKKLRTFLTNAQKLQLKQFWGEQPDLQLPAVVAWVHERFGVCVGRATLYRIYHAPAEQFAGNAQQKKRRRVKFPQLERDVLAFYEDNRSNGAALSDDALLRAAAELRTRHGIAETDLKLSNGWLHRFKERHTLRVAPQATGEHNTILSLQVREIQEVATESRAKPQRKPRVPPRSKVNKSSDVEEEDDAEDIQAPEQTLRGSTNHVQEWPVADASSTFEDTAERAMARPRTAFQSLTYITAVAVDLKAAAGFVRWKRNSGMADIGHFSVENDGVAILKSAVYQLNVELQHSVLASEVPSVIYKVWAGVEFLGQCECSVLNEGDRTLSVLQLQCALPAHSVVRVEYCAPGAVYTDSRLVLRLLNEFTQ